MAIQTDILIYGGTVSAVAAAVTAARQGLQVLILMEKEHIGGVLSSLGALETHYTGNRSSLMEELKEGVVSHYMQTYGPESDEYLDCVTLDPDNPMITYEPHVMEQVLEQMIAREERVMVIRNADIVKCRKTDLPDDRKQIDTVSIILPDDQEVEISARIFMDSSYAGDLMGTAGIPWRQGRESRSEYCEPHAGKMFTSWVRGRFPLDAVNGDLNILPKSTTFGFYSGSTGAGDDNVQSYSYRLCITDDPKNRVFPRKPQDYSREDYLGIVESPDESEKKQYALQHRFLTSDLQEMVAADHVFHGHKLPGRKRSWNATNFPGQGKEYALVGKEKRKEIEQRHLDHALGIYYFLQNDPEVPENIRKMAREWGLAKDEFSDNNNIPHNLYVREARRMEGEYTIVEQDLMLDIDINRAPVHSDSIAITDFCIDSLACTTERVPGSINDGQFFLQELTRPGQVPYSALIHRDFINFINPCTPSVSHVAWGSIRQTPTLIQISEAAAIASVLAIRNACTIHSISADALQRRILASGSMISFFNDFDMAIKADWMEAVQYLGTKGFFSTYNARADQLIERRIAELWIEEAAAIQEGRNNCFSFCRKIASVEKEIEVQKAVEIITEGDFTKLLREKQLQTGSTIINRDKGSALTIGEAAIIIYTILFPDKEKQI